MNSKTYRIIFILLSGTLAARSQSTLFWSFDTPHFTVQQSEQIFVTATVTNLSEVPFAIQGGGGLFAGDLQKTYSFVWTADLFGKTVPGYGTLQFAFGSLTPIDGSAPLGTYYADPALIDFAGIDDPRYLRYAQNTFDITVVPEPTIVSLLGLIVVVGFGTRWLRFTSLPMEKGLLAVWRQWTIGRQFARTGVPFADSKGFAPREPETANAFDSTVPPVGAEVSANGGRPRFAPGPLVWGRPESSSARA